MEYSVIFTASIPPTIEAVKQHFAESGSSDAEAEAFFLLHEKRKWKSKTGRCYQSWKGAATRWIKEANGK